MTDSPDSPPSSGSGGFQEDELLIQRCLLGDEAAWSRLVRKYANLIYAIPIRRGLDQETASDVFQSVFASLLGAMAGIRQPRALAGWLIQTTAHACDKLQNERQRWLNTSDEYSRFASAASTAPDPSLEDLEREKVLQQAIAAQNPECQKLIRLLFFSDPPVSYETAAQQLGLSKGSIGATRMRCLEKLRQSLADKSFRYAHGS